jgi:hypothetical protein
VWNFEVDGKFHDVILRHDNVTGKRKCILDGVVFFDEKIFPDKSSTHPFTIAGKNPREGSDGNYTGECIIEYDTSSGVLSDVIYYKLKFEGNFIIHSMQYEVGVEPWTFLERTRVNISESAMRVVDSKSVVFYIVAATSEDGAVTKTEHRFQEFEELNNNLVSIYSYSHIYDNLPPFPSKVTGFTNQFSEDFIKSRSATLQEYLNKMLRIPRINSNMDLIRFLGLQNYRDKKGKLEKGVFVEESTGDFM